MIRLSQLACRRGETTLFEPLNLTVSAGQCVEINGPNGAGKTTLLRTLAGIHQQFEGNFDVQPFVFQSHRLGLDGLLNPLENLAWYAGLEGKVVTEDELAEALRRVDMLSRAMTPVSQLSQGQQRRVAMARWLLSDARVWLLDEPLTALDAAGQELLANMLSSHCQADGAAMCSTHVPLDVPQRQVLELRQSEQARQVRV